MKILLLGKNGQVGFELQRSLAPLGEIMSYDQDEADFQNLSSVCALVRSKAPDVIVNAAAYTAVDKAESEERLCHLVNAEGPALLAEEARRLDSLLIHYSTDYVYPGNKSVPYLEDSATGPLGVYGQSKLQGDKAIQRSGAHYLIFRTAWVYGAHGQNFLRTMLRLANEKSELRIVSDQIGAPTWSRMIAEGTAHAIVRTMSDRAKYSGLYHLTAAGETSWFGFAEAIFNDFRIGQQPKLVPIATTEYPTAARRPAYSVLSNDKFAQTFGVRLPHWRHQLGLVAEDATGWPAFSPALAKK